MRDEKKKEGEINKMMKEKNEKASKKDRKGKKINTDRKQMEAKGKRKEEKKNEKKKGNRKTADLFFSWFLKVLLLQIQKIKMHTYKPTHVPWRMRSVKGMSE